MVFCLTPVPDDISRLFAYVLYCNACDVSLSIARYLVSLISDYVYVFCLNVYGLLYHISVLLLHDVLILRIYSARMYSRTKFVSLLSRKLSLFDLALSRIFMIVPRILCLTLMFAGIQLELL